MVGADVGSAVRAPGAWGPFEAAVQAIVAQECDDLGEVRRQLGGLVQQFGPRVPGLTHELTHLFPSAEVLAAGDLADLDLPPATTKSLAALAAGVASGEIVLDHSVRRTDLVASLTAATGIQLATAHQIALRLGHREPARGKPADEGMRPCREHVLQHRTSGSARYRQRPIR